MNSHSTTFQDTVLEDETPRSEGTDYMTRDELRSITNSAVNNDATESKPKELRITDTNGTTKVF